MESLYVVLLVVAPALIVFAVAAVTMVRRRRQSPDASWRVLRWPAWIAFVAAIISMLGTAAAFAVALAGASDFGAVQVMFALFCVAIVGAFYLCLVHPLLKIVRERDVRAAARAPRSPGRGRISAGRRTYRS